MPSPCPSGRGAPSRGSPGWWAAGRRRATRGRWGWCCTRRASWRRAPRAAGHRGGRQAIEENRDEVLRSLHGADMVFVTCGMGGGTGTGASPIIAQMARDLGALTIGIVTKPFLFEGRKRMRQADMGIAEMRKHVDTMVVVPNERLLAVVGKGIPFQDALKKADEVLLHATQGISSLITVTGIVNVDFADVRTVMQNGGASIMGTGTGRGENRAMEAVQQAISSPLLDNISIT